MSPEEHIRDLTEQLLVAQGDARKWQEAAVSAAATAEAALGRLILAESVILAAGRLVDAPDVAVASRAGEALVIAVWGYRAGAPS